ncbi:toxin-antitoxin system YwqK family antitoxin [Thermonema rossianum]|uniref:toxin-antitoxin system YwqK family antitoxin n=1 Tax=Thermonema rossianum TaxID=55505 RepID=UPI0012FB8C56|nr:hypothetical protein [Thermonema rossianum]
MRSIYFLLACLIGFELHAQTPSILETDSIPDLSVELSQKKEKKDKGRKIKKRRVYYGVKTKKTFIKHDNGTVEIFHYLPEWHEPYNKVEEIAWYWEKRRKLYHTEYGSIKRGEAKLLHGPYRKLYKDQVMEEGFYYYGAKHGRWVRYGRDALDRDWVLIDKTKYFRGWLKESKRTYYDEKQNKLKEVIPIKHGKLEGNYYFFYPNGRIAIKGQYEAGQRVGVWMEYYPNGQRKREIHYPRKPDTNEKPYILRQWDERGKETRYQPHEVELDDYHPLKEDREEARLQN